jgi:hypothetical protein
MMRGATVPGLRDAAGLAGVVFVLSGCAWLTRPDEDVMPPWRVAEVVAVGPRSSWARPLTLDCKSTPSEARDDSVFAVLLYRDGPRHARRMRTARVPVIDALHVGERVHFDSVDCLVAKIPRILLSSCAQSNVLRSGC